LSSTHAESGNNNFGFYYSFKGGVMMDRSLVGATATINNKTKTVSDKSNGGFDLSNSSLYFQAGVGFGF